MQSDTFMNNTDSEDEEYSSDSSGDLPENKNILMCKPFVNTQHGRRPKYNV